MKKIIAGNWKLHHSPSKAREFVAALTQRLSASPWKEMENLSQLEFALFPSAAAWESVSESLAKKSSKHILSWGGQNAWTHPVGAFTGENSAQVLKELGAKYLLVGHSERRAIFKESGELIAQKMAAALQMGLVPLLCVGETLPERESGQTLRVVESQLNEALSGLSQSQEVVIAYEPVWAIGTGRVASSAQVAEAHFGIRSILAKMRFSESVPILYGGSVKPENSTELIGIPDVGGFLVGGASLEVDSFLKIAAPLLTHS